MEQIPEMSHASMEMEETQTGAAGVGVQTHVMGQRESLGKEGRGEGRVGERE